MPHSASLAMRNADVPPQIKMRVGKKVSPVCVRDSRTGLLGNDRSAF